MLQYSGTLQPATGPGPDSDVKTDKFLKKLAKEDPEQYRKVFAEFRKVSTTWKAGGRGQKRGNFSPQSVIYSEAATATKRKKLSANATAMDKIDYLHHFQHVVPLGKRLTYAEAQLAWARDLSPNSDLDKVRPS